MNSSRLNVDVPNQCVRRGGVVRQGTAADSAPGAAARRHERLPVQCADARACAVRHVSAVSRVDGGEEPGGSPAIWVDQF